jgi:hypothetical protein
LSWGIQKVKLLKPVKTILILRDPARLFIRFSGERRIKDQKRKKLSHFWGINGLFKRYFSKNKGDKAKKRSEKRSP